MSSSRLLFGHDRISFEPSRISCSRRTQSQSIGESARPSSERTSRAKSPIERSGVRRHLSNAAFRRRFNAKAPVTLAGRHLALPSAVALDRI